jgi:2-oxoglutarate dehydrogenase E2 component (dihydrolipoamide succinyltransferase)
VLSFTRGISILTKSIKKMALTDIIMPKMGESITEATILKWNKQVGDSVALDENILDIATDKVDSEVPSPIAGIVKEILFAEGDVVAVGKTIARIAVQGAVTASPALNATPPAVKHVEIVETIAEAVAIAEAALTPNTVLMPAASVAGDRFYSPLVRNMAKEEGIASAELDTIPGTGAEGRLTKSDLSNYIKNRSTAQPVVPVQVPVQQVVTPVAPQVIATSAAVSLSGATEIIEMDRMRKLIAEHMVKSVQTAPHVTSFIEADVTNLVKWRERAKKDFERKHGEKITFTPIFIEAVARAIVDFPMINVSVDGTKIIVKKDINIGVAAALPTGNLIVPVIKAADQLNLVGLARSVNDLSARARIGKLKPDETQGGTFTLSNVGTFGNVMGTPIINQPQVAILAVGAIRKKPAVLETEYGDVIAVRQMMFLSLSYDHRVVDGALGGSFLRRIADYLEGFDANRGV